MIKQTLWSLATYLIISRTYAQQSGNKICRDKLPTLSVNNGGYLDLARWDKLKKQKDLLIILGISDSNCAQCCQSEGILNDFQELGMKYKGKLIQIARIDISTKGSNAVLEKEDITFDSVPRVIIFKDQRFYSYDSGYDRLDLIIHHINRVINPIVTLNTEEEIEWFLGLESLAPADADISAFYKKEQEKVLPFWSSDYNTAFLKQLGTDKIPRLENHWRGQSHQTRVVCFLYDKQEYKEELQNLRKDAKFLSTRDDLRIGLVDNQRLVKKMKSGKYGPRLFFPISMSSLVLRRYDGILRVHDITGDDHVAPHHWINKFSLREIEELNTANYRISELIRQPMFLTFVDFEDPRYSRESYRAVEVMKEVAPKYSHLINFFYVNNTHFWQRKRVLGVTWDELPSMAFNMIGDASKVIPYPRGAEISKKALFDFFDDLFTGRKGVGGAYQPPKDFSKVRNDTEIETYLLNNTILANRDTFNSLIYSEGYDVLLLLYTTEVIHEGQRNVALQFNLVGDAFNKLREAFAEQKVGSSVRVVAYDVNVNAFPEGIDFTLDLPQILFFPAYKKRPPFKRYTSAIGPTIAGPILEFVQRNADVHFKFPVDISRVGYPKNATETQSQSEVRQEEEVNNEVNIDRDEL